MALPVDSYIRVSQVGDRSGETYISVDVQAKANAAKARELGLELRENAPEENVSGGTMDRPVFNAIMERIRAGESGGIIVYRLDRFARTLIGGYAAMSEIAAHGAVFASASEAQFNFATPSGRMMLQLHLMMAEYFRGIQKDSWRMANVEAVGRGVHPAGYGAFGYDRESGHLLPNDEATFVVEAFRMRVEDRASFGQIADWLNANAPAHRDRDWTAQYVGRMLRRRIYLGEAFHGVTQNAGGGDAIVNADAHEAIIPEGLFLAAQKIRHHFSPPRADRVVPVLQGLVRCANCRYVMSSASTGKVGTAARSYHYRCPKHHASGECELSATVMGPRIEEYVEGVVCAMLDKRAAEYTGSPVHDELARAESVLAVARADVEAMRTDADARKRLGARWLDWLEPYLAAEEAATAHLAEVTAGTTATISGMTADAYRGLPREERRHVLTALIDAVMVRRGKGRGRNVPALSPDRVVILWAGTAPEFPAARRFNEDGLTPWPWPEDEPKTALRLAA